MAPQVSSEFEIQAGLESQIVVVVIKYDCPMMLLPPGFTCSSLIFQNVPFL